MGRDRTKLPITRPDAAYEVGYGKPPSDSRFKPGQSGNPKGRPRGAKNKRPALNEERLKGIILDEAYRDITVRDGERNVTVPMARAIIRALAVNAAKGNHRAQQMFADLLSTTEAQNKAQADELLKTAIDYKLGWEEELRRRFNMLDRNKDGKLDDKDRDRERENGEGPRPGPRHHPPRRESGKP